MVAKLKNVARRHARRFRQGKGLGPEGPGRIGRREADSIEPLPEPVFDQASGGVGLDHRFQGQGGGEAVRVRLERLAPQNRPGGFDAGRNHQGPLGHAPDQPAQPAGDAFDDRERGELFVRQVAVPPDAGQHMVLFHNGVQLVEGQEGRSPEAEQPGQPLDDFHRRSGVSPEPEFPSVRILQGDALEPTVPDVGQADIGRMEQEKGPERVAVLVDPGSVTPNQTLHDFVHVPLELVAVFGESVQDQPGILRWVQHPDDAFQDQLDLGPSVPVRLLEGTQVSQEYGFPEIPHIGQVDEDEPAVPLLDGAPGGGQRVSLAGPADAHQDAAQGRGRIRGLGHPVDLVQEAGPEVFIEVRHMEGGFLPDAFQEHDPTEIDGLERVESRDGVHRCMYRI